MDTIDLTVEHLKNIHEFFKGVVVIMWGLPGSGKSTYTSHLKDVCDSFGCAFEKVSADDYFLDKNGHYNFDPLKLSENHKKAQKQFLNYIINYQSKQAERPVFVVDNTNLLRGEWAEYAKIARENNYFVLLKSTNDCLNLEECSKPERNTHMVPFNVLERRYELHMKKPFYPLYGGLFFSVNNPALSDFLQFSIGKINESPFFNDLNVVEFKRVEEPHVTFMHNFDGEHTAEILELNKLQKSTFTITSIFISKRGTISLHGSITDDMIPYFKMDHGHPHITLAVTKNVKPREAGEQYSLFVKHPTFDVLVDENSISNEYGILYHVKPTTVSGLMSLYWN